jgi:hypothetical protein
MKILCSCGAKFAVDVTPEMVQRPVQFICPSCGADSSTTVNELIQREWFGTAPAVAPVATIVAAAPSRIHVEMRSASNACAPIPAESTTQTLCLKHPGQSIAHQCMVCGKSMCIKCMELFGYVCSPFCKSRAEARKMHIPQYAGQKSVTEARHWRKVGMMTAGIAAALSLLIGGWVWYEWFGSRPKPFFSVAFLEGIHSGQSEFCGMDQLVFLHGVTISRYDLKSKKEVWSRQLVDQKRLDELKAEQTRFAQNLVTQAKEAGWSRIPPMATEEEIIERAERVATSMLDLFVQGSNVWLTAEAGKLVRLDWDTGEPVKEVPIIHGYNVLSRNGEELTMRSQNELRQRVVTHINLTTGDTRVETFGSPVQPVAAGRSTAGRRSSTTPGGTARTAGLPTAIPGADMNVPMDPAKVAADAQRLSLPGKIVLPATVANAMNQERILRELNSGDDEADLRRAFQTAAAPGDRVMQVSGKHGNYAFSVRLLEERMVERVAMKAPPKKSALDGDVNVTQTMEIANELLNEMQRNRGGDKVYEDESRFLVTVHDMDSRVPDWAGEVVGPPTLIPSKSVTVIASGSTVTVLDKSNKKLWQGSLTHKVAGSKSYFQDSPFGELPCAERDGRLYVCDEAMLTAFDLQTGNVFWRLPSVGIAGLLFDDQGMLYINTTTASPDSIKYSRQIDVSRKVSEVIVKVDSKTGKMLWSTQAGGFISYLSGKYIYIASWNDADDDKDSPLRTELETPSYVRIKRIDPKKGTVMWDHYQPRAPLDVKFNGNRIQIVFKKEMQVLKYLTL